MSNAVFFMRDQTPVLKEVRDGPGSLDIDLLGFSVLAADAGKGVAEELLIDLEFNPAEPGVAEELLIDLETDLAELERVRGQPKMQAPDRIRYLENSEERLLIDMNLAELEELWTQTPDIVGYLENLEENIMIPEICKLQDGPDLRISTNLDDLLETRGDNSELGGPLGVNEIKLEIIIEIDNVHLIKLHQRMKSCRLYVIIMLGFLCSIIVTLLKN